MKCSLCGSPDITRFLDLGRQPLANKYPKAEQFATEDFFPLEVFFCERCKNVQLGTMVSRERMFEDYYYLSSVNKALVRHFEEFARTLAGARFVVDVGSNDGILLKPLKEMGVKALGVEPSINVSKIAIEAGFPTLTAFFDDKSARQIRDEHGPADVIVASSVFTHLENPAAFIEASKLLLSDDGALVIEVEYIGNILSQTQFERFYLDRIFYYSLSSLMALFESHDMFIADAEDIEPHGGSLRVVARRRGQGQPSAAVARLLAREEPVLTPARLEAFRREVDAQITAFRDKLLEYKRQGLKVAGYGSPARVATICNYGRIGPEQIEFIIDDSPLKQNRFTPGTHIPIVPRAQLADRKPDVLVVFAYEYFDDIRAKTGGGYRYLIPIPPREVS